MILGISRVEISLSFLISSWVLVGPGLEFPDIEKTGRGTVSTWLVFLGKKKLKGALSGARLNFYFLNMQMTDTQFKETRVLSVFFFLGSHYNITTATENLKIILSIIIRCGFDPGHMWKIRSGPDRTLGTSLIISAQGTRLENPYL